MNERDRQLAADYLLGELDQHTREAFEHQVTSDPALRAHVERLRPVVGRLRELPAGAWPPAPTARRQRPARRRVLVAAAAAALLLVVGAAGGWLIRGDGRDTVAGPAVVLRPLGSTAGAARARAVMSGGGRMVIVVARLPDPGPGRYYEAWLLNSPDDLVPVTSFNVSRTGSARLVVRLPVTASRFHFIDVSVQRTGGGTAHSGDSVLRGRLPSA